MSSRITNYELRITNHHLPTPNLKPLTPNSPPMSRRTHNRHSLTWPQRGIFLGCIAFVGVWLYLASLEWRGEVRANQILNHRVPVKDFDPVPLATAPQYQAAQTLLAVRDTDFDYIDSLMADAVQKRPLYGPYWLTRAEAAFRAGNNETALEYANTAETLWPTRPIHLWRVAMLYARMGEAERTLNTLKAYLYSNPGGVARAFGVAARLVSDPEILLAKLLPEDSEERQVRDGIAWSIHAQARRRKDAELAQAAWQAMTPAAQNDTDKRRSYTEWLAGRDDAARAMAVWQAGNDALENGSFEAPLTGGLNWRLLNLKEAASAERDQTEKFDGSFSLKVVFSGQENMNLHHLRQYLPVTSAKNYILRYAWRGQDITTRSGPYIDVVSRGIGRLARDEQRWGTWNWQQRELVFTAPEDKQFVEIRLRRNRTRGSLNNKIGGTLWLDGFELLPAVAGDSA